MEIKAKRTLISTLKNNFRIARLGIIENCFIVIFWIIFFPKDDITKFFTWFFLFLIGMNILSLAFVSVFIHIQYFKFEKNRKIHLEEDKMIINRDNIVVSSFLKKDIIDIGQYDKQVINIPNFFPTCIDNYFYVVIKLENQKNIIITSLMGTSVTDDITAWSGLEIKRHRQFFPFIKKEFLKNALEPQ